MSVASLSQTAFHEKCQEAGGACAVEMDQENAIALLLKQQQEVLRELRDQKKKQGLSLTQANKKEIACLVLSLIEKRHLHDFEAAAQPPLPRDARWASPRSSKQVKSMGRRHKLSSSSRYSGATGTIRDGATQQRAVERGFPSPKKEFDRKPNKGLNHKPAEVSLPCYRGLHPTRGKAMANTIIRQRVERRPEAVSFSLDESWLLPSVSSHETQDSGGRRSLEARRWAEMSSRSKVASLPSETNIISTARCSSSEIKLGPRPVTTSFGTNGAKHLVRGERSRGTMVTGSVGRGTYCGDASSNRSLSIHVEAYPTNGRMEQGVDCGSKTVSLSTSGDGITLGEGGGGVPMSRDALAMLERSRSLVARAKACEKSDRSSPRNLLESRKRGESCRTEEGRARFGRERFRYQSKPEENPGELGILTNETSSILFPCLSPADAHPGVGAAHEPDAACSLPSPSKAKEVRTAVDQDPKQSDDVDCTNGDIEGRFHHGGRTRIKLQGDSFGIAPASAVESQALAALGMTRIEEEGAIVRELKRLGNKEEVCALESDASRCELKPVLEVDTPARRTLEGGGDESVPAALCSPSATTDPDVAPAAVATIPHQKGRMELRAGAGSGWGGLGNSSAPVKAKASYRCRNRSALPRHERRRRHSCIGGGEGGGGSGDNIESPVKIDSEWENTIAKNILSLYQTKLKTEFDKKKGVLEDGCEPEPRGYLTAVEEENLVWERQAHRWLTKRDNGSKATRSSNKDPESEGCRTGAKKRRGTDPPRGPSLPRSSCSSRELAATATYEETRDGAAIIAPARNYGYCPGRGTADTAMVNTTAAGAAPPNMSGGSKENSPSGTRRMQSISTEASGGFGLGRAPPPDPSGQAMARVSVRSGRSGTKVGAAGASTTGWGGFRGNRTISVPTREGSEVVVVVPKRPTPVWFAGSGAIQAKWSALPGGARIVRDLESLEEQGSVNNPRAPATFLRREGKDSYKKYVALVEGLLAAHLRADDQRGPTTLVKRLWRQLVVTCTAFGVRCIETRRFERALDLLKRAEMLLSRQVLDKRELPELRAFISDAYGLYYLKRGKPTAALDYVQKAMRVHARTEDWGHVAKCHLHSAVVLSRLNRHDEALRCLGQVLSMVQEGKLDVGGNSPQKLCLVAICYHNIAVEQLILRDAGEACMSSQNARRLARLCLSYSNRWLHSFEGTHKLALAELARVLSPPKSTGRSGALTAQRGMLDRLVEELSM